MTNAITYPAAYNVLSCEEMTYTEGGVGVVEAAMAWFPLYGWYKAVSTIHDYRKANINSNWVENGINALVAHAEKSPTNTIHDIGCSFWFAASCVSIIGLVPNALIIFGSYAPPCISLNKHKAAASPGWEVPPLLRYAMLFMFSC